MAINKTKIPSQDELKSSPQPFSKEEIENLKNLKSKINELTYQFGNLYINKIKLEEAETILKKQLATLEKEEKDTANNLSERYGKGSIDLESGTFTPSE